MPERRCPVRRALLFLCLLLVSLPVPAHRLKVFAFAEGADVRGSAYFAGGGKAAGAHILILDAAGETLARLRPDGDGRFSYRAPAAQDLRVVARSDDGHRAEWRIAAAELAGGFPGAAVGEDPGGEGMEPKAVAAPSTPASTPDPDAVLAAAIERAVGRQVEPLRRELIAAREALRLRDLLGGLGYIFGLAGLALWWRARGGGSGP